MSENYTNEKKKNKLHFVGLELTTLHDTSQSLAC